MPLPGIAQMVGGMQATDPYFSNVVLLMHGDGVNQSQVFTQNQITPITLTTNNNTSSSIVYPCLDTSQKLYGSASITTNGGGGCVNSSDVTSIQLTGDFTVEFAFAWRGGKGDTAAIVDLRKGTGDNQPLIDTNSGNLRWRYSGPFASVSTGSLSNNTWYRVAMTKSGSTLRAYFNGNLVNTDTSSNSGNTRLTIGNYTDVRGSGTYSFDGWVDELRITKGVARYTGSSYTLASAPFPNM